MARDGIYIPKGLARALKDAGLKSLSQISGMSLTQLLKTKGLGKKRVLYLLQRILNG